MKPMQRKLKNERKKGGKHQRKKERARRRTTKGNIVSCPGKGREIKNGIKRKKWKRKWLALDLLEGFSPNREVRTTKPCLVGDEVLLEGGWVGLQSWR